MPDPTSFVTGNVQAVEAAEQSVQQQERTGSPGIDVACGAQHAPGMWRAVCADEVDGAPLPLMARAAVAASPAVHMLLWEQSSVHRVQS